jgi:hypothetical protein
MGKKLMFKQSLIFFRERAGELRIIKLREETVQNGPKYNDTKGQTQDHQNLTKHKTTNTCYAQECRNAAD